MDMAREESIVRELAKRYMDIALSDRHARMRRRFRDSNDLKIVRPPLIMEEIPWHEMNMDGELDCLCQDETLRGMEYRLRVQLFREKHFRCDNYIEPVWVIDKASSSTGIGFSIQEKRLSVDRANNIVSHEYSDVLADERSLERYHDPVVTAYPEIDAPGLSTCIRSCACSFAACPARWISAAPWDSMIPGPSPFTARRAR